MTPCFHTTTSMLESGNKPRSELPYDILLNIAAFIPHRDLHRLLSVHRSFFEIGLARKYSHVEWTRLDEVFIHFLNRLQSPIISCRVRKLYIRAWFIAFLLKRDARSQRTLPSSKILSTLRSAVSTWRPLPCHFDPELDMPDHISYDASPITSTKQLTACKAIRFMVSAIRGMTNVMEFQFEWTDLPLTDDTKTFLTSIGTAFGSNLRKLTLHAHVLNFRDLQVITPSTPVEELELHFDYSARTSSTKATKDNSCAEHQELLAVVLPLIVHSSSAMRSLMIFSSSSVDLSDLFVALPLMPHLQRFGVAIPFEKTIFSDSFGLLDFLRRHSSSLCEVHLSPNLPYRTDMLQLRKKEVWEPFNDSLLDDMALLSALKSLEIPFVSLRKTIPLLQRSADTLTSLVLTNHILSFVEVKDVLSVFSHRQSRLKTFHAEADRFTSSQMREYRKYR